MYNEHYILELIWGAVCCKIILLRTITSRTS